MPGPDPACTSTDQFLVGPALDLTVYADDLTQPDFDTLLELYRAVCPVNRRTRWKLAENPFYLPFQDGRHGSTGSREMDRFRQRVAGGWRAEFRLWDGQRDESWSFHAYRMPRTSDDSAGRVLPVLLPATATRRSFGGWPRWWRGRCGAVRPRRLYPALRRNSADHRLQPHLRPRPPVLGARCEAPEFDDPADAPGDQGGSWLTLVGPGFAEKLGGPVALDTLAGEGVTVSGGAGGVLVTAGPAPDRLDQHRPDTAANPYSWIARSLEPVFLPEFPDLPGRFVQEGNSATWFRRSLDPAGWRQ